MILRQKAVVWHVDPDQADTDKEHFFIDPNHSGISIDIQPLSAELSALHDTVLGKSFLAFTTCTGIYNGDKITISGSNDTYLVKSKATYELGRTHTELVLVEPPKE